MTASDRPPFEQAFEIHGVGVSLGASEREVFERVVALLPAGTPERDPDDVEERFMILSLGQDAWYFVGPAARTTGFADVALPLGMLDTALRAFVAERAADKVFVQAGAVAYRGRVVVIPGGSFSGKSTLVAALIRAGADYYSDEYAVLDEHGFVHPYGCSPVKPIPVGLVAATTYVPDAHFDPERLSPGQGMLVLLEHTAYAQSRSAKALAAVRHAVSNAVVVAGTRGDADAAAQVLLELLTKREVQPRDGRGAT